MGVLFLGVLGIRAILVGVYVRGRDFWTPPSQREYTRYPEEGVGCASSGRGFRDSKDAARVLPKQGYS